MYFFTQPVQIPISNVICNCRKIHDKAATSAVNRHIDDDRPNVAVPPQSPAKAVVTCEIKKKFCKSLVKVLQNVSVYFTCNHVQTEITKNLNS